ncbi:MAG: OmpA family protein [Deltaproteobacteria bacterium]|nr:OmpA family protein [Deltaproteobacteria bacterium]
MANGPSGHRHLAVSIAALCAVGCATVSPSPLPPLPKGSAPEVAGAYRGAEKSYDRCSRAYLAAQWPWQLYPALGGGAVAVGAVGTAAGLAGYAHLDRNAALATVAGLGALGAVAAGAAALFGIEAWRQWQREEAYKQVLDVANGRAAEAIAGRDALAMTELTRILNEECRAVSSSNGSTDAFLVLQDEQRWREHVAKLESERTGMVRERDQALRDLDGARGQLNADAVRIRGLEGAVAERESQNTSLRGEVARLEEAQATLSKRQQQLLEEKRKLEEQTTHYAELEKALKAEVAQGRVALRRLRDGVVVEMPNKVLFPSGSADLNDVGKQTLQAVAGAVRNLTDRRIRIEGHTDNVPVGKDLPYASNWELSAARAITVTKFMQENGVSPSNMSAEARSEYAPIAPNANEDGRSRNRRIEIYLVPKPLGSTEALKLEGAAP